MTSESVTGVCLVLEEEASVHYVFKVKKPHSFVECRMLFCLAIEASLFMFLLWLLHKYTSTKAE